MERYSQYFSTVYDEQIATGQIGRGTHYSILRATSWHTPDSGTLPRACHHDFSVIWDEDHDRRVITCAEEIYLNGLLSNFIMLGEKKGMLTAVLPKHCVSGRGDEKLNNKISWIAENCVNDDYFTSNIIRLDDPKGIISDTEEKVELYLGNINMLWQLGNKSIPSKGDGGELFPFPQQP